MTVATISERTLTIDDKTGSGQNYSALLVGGLGDLGKIVDAIQDVTGATDTRPQKKYTDFADNQPFTLQFEADVGGSPDPVDDFYISRRTGNPRTVSMTWNTTGTTWTWACECYIADSKPITEPGEGGVTLIEVTFQPTGTETLTYA